MFSIFTSKHNRDNDDLTNFGFRYDDDTYYDKVKSTLTAASFQSIDGQTNRTVLFKPLLGILNQEKYIPLRYAPLTFELELVGAATDCIIGQSGVFTAANTSITWSITNPILKCDVCMLDNAVDNQIADHILSGKPLPINYKTFISQYQTLSTTTLSANVAIARAVSRLNAIFISFNYGNTAATTAFRTNNVFLKDFNTFYHPMSVGTAEVNAAAYDSTLEVEYEISIGSKKFPEYNIRSQAEAYSQLEKTIKDIYLNDYNSMSIRPKEYISDKHIVGINTTKVWSTLGSGISTRNGDLLRIGCKAASSGAPTAPTEIHVVLVSDNIIEIKDSGVTVFG